MKLFNYKVTYFIFACLWLVVLSSCSSQRIVTTWKSNHVETLGYKRILVVAILPDKDIALREKTENSFVSTLEQTGYKTGSALKEFGAKGLSNSGQENTYLKLYNSGYDAVLTVALIRKTKQNFHRPGQAYIHPNSYYYNRIWEYKNIQAEDTSFENAGEPEYFWETILFDLSSLEAACTVRTQPFAKDKEQETNDNLAKRIIRKITREKVLQKQKTPKAF